MNSEFVGKFCAFKGEDTVVDSTNVLLEVTEVDEQEVEIAFNAPIPGKPRCYVRFKLAELVQHCMPEK